MNYIQRWDDECLLFLKGVEREYLTAIHQRLQDLIKPKLHRSIESMLEEYKICEKLSNLERRVADTRQTREHEAWRPSLTGEGVMQATAAHDLQVMTEEKIELEALLHQLDTEVEILEKQVEEAEVVITTNMEDIKNRVDILQSVSDTVNEV